MKKLIYIILIIFLISDIAYSQNRKSVKSKTSVKKALVADSTKKCNNGNKCGFSKSGGNGKNCKHQGQCRMKDTFVDKDGDGINDNRCSGMGLGHKKQKGKCCKKK